MYIHAFPIFKCIIKTLSSAQYFTSCQKAGVFHKAICGILEVCLCRSINTGVQLHLISKGQQAFYIFSENQLFLGSLSCSKKRYFTPCLWQNKVLEIFDIWQYTWKLHQKYIWTPKNSWPFKPQEQQILLQTYKAIVEAIWRTEPPILDSRKNN